MDKQTTRKIKNALKNQDYKIKINKKSYLSILRFFVNTLKENFDNNDLENLHNNLLTLGFKTLLFYPGYGGRYDIDNNNVVIYERRLHYIIHELFHFASSNRQSKNSGFRAYNTSGLMIGNGLDEGYTDALTYRYFFNKKFEQEVLYYVYEYLVTTALEYIIGKRKMEKLYLKANQKGLILEMCKYTNPEKISQFLRNTDYVSTNKILKSTDLDCPVEIQRNVYTKRLEICNFLLDMFYEKYKDCDDYDKKIVEFKELMTKSFVKRSEAEFKDQSKDVNISIIYPGYVDNYLNKKKITKSI